MYAYMYIYIYICIYIYIYISIYIYMCMEVALKVGRSMVTPSIFVRSFQGREACFSDVN